MKKRFLSLLMVFCLMLSLAPAAFAADDSGLQGLIDSATTNEITLTSDYTITDTVVINKNLTINGGGHVINYNGSGKALSITTEATVTLKNLTINATTSGAYAIDLSSSQPNLTLDTVTINVDTRGINIYSANGCDNGNLTLTNSTIQNSRVDGDYENNTSVGDTRGISLYQVENSTITITNSYIYGFGYSINTSANQDENGVRPASNTFNLTNSKIWGWSAFNIWTIGNTFNITTCDLRGINPLNTLGNSFSVIVLNNGIYGSNPSNVSPNVFNVKGGSMDAKMTVTTSMVEETVISIDNQFMSEFHFTKSGSGLFAKKVTLTCDKSFSAIIYDATGSTGLDTEFASWALSNKLTGPENTSYNQGSKNALFPNRGLLALGVYAGEAKSTTASLLLNASEDSFEDLHTYHEGGQSA